MIILEEQCLDLTLKAISPAPSQRVFDKKGECKWAVGTAYIDVWSCPVRISECFVSLIQREGG
jgi:hypothetical protein